MKISSFDYCSEYYLVNIAANKLKFSTITKNVYKLHKFEIKLWWKVKFLFICLRTFCAYTFLHIVRKERECNLYF